MAAGGNCSENPSNMCLSGCHSCLSFAVLRDAGDDVLCAEGGKFLCAHLESQVNVAVSRGQVRSLQL